MHSEKMNCQPMPVTRVSWLVFFNTENFWSLKQSFPKTQKVTLLLDIWLANVTCFNSGQDRKVEFHDYYFFTRAF